MKGILIIVAAVLLVSCGGKTDGAALAKEVCDCYQKTNALPTTDPNRSKEQDACLTRQGEAWKKVKDNKEEADKFNDEISKCSRGIINESVGGQ